MQKPGTPQFRLKLWRPVLETPEFKRIFKDKKEVQFRHEIMCTRQMVWERVLSKSYISLLDAESQSSLKDEIDQILDQPDVVFNQNGQVSFPYTTDVISFVKV